MQALQQVLEGNAPRMRCQAGTFLEGTSEHVESINRQKGFGAYKGALGERLPVTFISFLKQKRSNDDLPLFTDSKASSDDACKGLWRTKCSMWQLESPSVNKCPNGQLKHRASESVTNSPLDGGTESQENTEVCI